ncbi:MAG: hypothetical protein M3360_06600 [Actinomycetota bacterium]|nr:hypothetical protein [Actinomycetota bacterium]
MLFRDKRQLNPFLIVVLALTVLGTFQGAFVGSLMGTSVIGAVIGATVGLVWGLVLEFIARLVSRREKWSLWAGNATLFLGAVVMGIKLGGALLISMELTAVLRLSPEAVSASMGGPDVGTSFVYVTNGSMEWLVLPAIVLFNWHSPRRRTIMVAALIFYLERIWTYTYFGPVITGIQSDFTDGVAISQVLPDLEQWGQTELDQNRSRRWHDVWGITTCGLHSNFWL